MMRNLYVVQDTVAVETIGPVMSLAHDAAAVREFQEALANPQSLGRRPADYVLVRVAALDTETLQAEVAGPVVILTGAAWLATQDVQLAKEA